MVSILRLSSVRRLWPVWALVAGSVFADTAVPTAVIDTAGARGGFELDGSLQAVRQSTVAAQVGGNVMLLAVRAGDRVKAGQLLARIDERDAQATLRSADAGVSQADAQLALARTSAERARQLRQTGFVSQAALDDAETRLRAAEAGLEQARAGRAQAQLARGFATVVAPFDAVVLATHVEAGELASAGRPIVTLYAPGALRAVVQLPSSRSAAARSATAIAVQRPDGRWLEPVRRTELPAADAVSQTVEWRLDLPADQTAGLAPGQAVRVRFQGTAVSGGERPLVPASAVLRRGELTAVYAVDGQRFVLKAVRLGAATGEGFELLAGLARGERIALDPVRAGLAGAVPQ